MAVSKVTTVLLLASCVFANPMTKHECYQGNGEEALQCRKDLVQELFRDYSAGIPDLGLKPLDPIYLDEFEVNEESINVKFSYPNFRVEHFRHVIVNDISEKNDTDALTYSMSFSFTAEGPIRIEFTQKKKAFVGKLKYEGSVSADIIHAFYTTTLHTPTSTITEQVAAPEQIACESTHVTSRLAPELEKAFNDDSDVQAMKDQYKTIQKEHQKKVACAIGEAILKVAMNNIRAYYRFTFWK